MKIDVAEWLRTNPLITSFSPLNSQILALIGVNPTGSSSLFAFFRPAGVDAGSMNSTSSGTINPSNLSDRGNEVSPNEERVTICHDGQTLTLPRDAAQKHLQNHPCDSAGACR